MGLGDVAAIKLKAEAGDAAAQVALADALPPSSMSRKPWFCSPVPQGRRMQIPTKRIPAPKVMHVAAYSSLPFRASFVGIG